MSKKTLIEKLARLFPVKARLSQAEVRQGLGFVVRDGMAGQAMASLTGSAFLVAYALHLGASNAVIGVLAAIPHLSQLFQIPAIYLVEKIKNRRAISVVVLMTGRFSWLCIAAAPFLFSRAATLLILVGGLLTASVMAAVSNCAWNSWIHELVPTHELGAFFGKRFSLATGTGVVVSMAGAFFIDHYAAAWFGDQQYGYPVLFTAGFLMGVLSVYFIARIPEPRMSPPTGSVVQSILQPFREENFRNLIKFMGAWNFAVYLATPFFSVYMLKQLGMDLASVIGLIVIGRIVNIFFLRLWGSFSDRVSNTSVLSVSGPLCLLCILAWTFTTLPDKHFLTLPLLVVLHIVMGVAMAGVTLSTGNIGFKLAPKGKATSYLASLNFINAVAAGVAPLIAGQFADFFVDRKLAWTLTWSSANRTISLDVLNIQQWDFLFVLAFLVGLYALHRLSFVREVGEVKEKIVVYELFSVLGREVRDFATVGGLRNIATLLRFESGKIHHADTPSDTEDPPAA